MASLWPVVDPSTSLLITEFYRLKAANPSMTKAEALQLAQLAMMRGKLGSPQQTASAEGDKTASGKTSGKTTSAKAGDCAVKLNGKCASDGTGSLKTDPNAPFSHPKYWSPFVMIGNWR